jgi:hypothetical protein
VPGMPAPIVTAVAATSRGEGHDVGGRSDCFISVSFVPVSVFHDCSMC